MGRRTVSDRLTVRCENCRWWSPSDDGDAGLCTLISNADGSGMAFAYGPLRSDAALFTRAGFGCVQFEATPCLTD